MVSNGREQLAHGGTVQRLCRDRRGVEIQRRRDGAAEPRAVALALRARLGAFRAQPVSGRVDADRRALDFVLTGSQKAMALPPRSPRPQ